jgi:aspartyl-tRNA(Asn)/glutamyl-tRNA(Gln) amidotransferase subunit C
MSLSKAEVEHVARLARLELSEAEKAQFTVQLNEILQFVAQLNQLDTSCVELTAQAIPVRNGLRPDRVAPSLDPELALANAPDRLDNFFKVPKVLEDEN